MNKELTLARVIETMENNMETMDSRYMSMTFISHKGNYISITVSDNDENEDEK